MVLDCHAKEREGGYFKLTKQCDSYDEKTIGKLVMNQCDHQARLEELKEYENIEETKEDKQV